MKKLDLFITDENFEFLNIQEKRGYKKAAIVRMALDDYEAKVKQQERILKMYGGKNE